MPGRTTETTVTFRRSFQLEGMDKPLGPGTYRIAVDEEEVLGLSFLAFQRVATYLHAPDISATAGPYRMFAVDPDELAAALEADAC